MSHIVAAYAKNTGSKIGKPYIYQQYFPLPPCKFITIHSSSSLPSKVYDYFDLVIALAFPVLSQHGFKIIQIGAPDDPALPNVIDFRGKTRLHQDAYIMARTSLHLSGDTFSMHVAASFKRPVIGLFGATLPAISGPYWNDPAKTCLLEGDLNGNHPSYSGHENPKVINSIKPEKIVNNLFGLLGLTERCNIETLYIGQNFNKSLIELIPDQVVNPDIAQGVMDIRADLLTNDENVFRQLQLSKCVVVTDHPMDVDILIKLKQNVALVVLDLDNNNMLDMARKLKRAGIQIVLISGKTEEEINAMKLDYCEFGVIQNKQKTLRDSVDSKGKIGDNTYCSTKRIFLSNKQVFASAEHWKNKQPCVGISNTESKIIDTPNFWEKADSLFIYNKI